MIGVILKVTLTKIRQIYHSSWSAKTLKNWAQGKPLGHPMTLSFQLIITLGTIKSSAFIIFITFDVSDYFHADLVSLAQILFFRCTTRQVLPPSSHHNPNR